jgi:hypothetical protein
MKLARGSAALFAVLVVVALLAGCGDSAEDDAQAKVCAARDDIAKQVDQLKGLTLTTATTDQVSESLDAIKKDLSTMKDARSDLSDERRQDLNVANAAFAAAMRDTAATVGRSVSIESARQDAQQSLDQLASSYKSSFGQIDCS